MKSKKQKANESEDLNTDNMSATEETIAADGITPENVSGTEESTDYVGDEGEETEEIDELEALRIEVSQLKDTLLRRAAEYENSKKRMLRERMQLLEDAKIEALKAFLPINDDLQRSVKASEGVEIPASFLQGVTMVAEKFENVLSTSGVEVIAEENVPFDVNLHDALMRRAADDSTTPSDTVLQILEPGYKVGNKVIRHAKVIVSE